MAHLLSQRSRSGMSPGAAPALPLGGRIGLAGWPARSPSPAPPPTDAAAAAARACRTPRRPGRFSPWAARTAAGAQLAHAAHHAADSTPFASSPPPCVQRRAPLAPAWTWHLPAAPPPLATPSPPRSPPGPRAQRRRARSRPRLAPRAHQPPPAAGGASEWAAAAPSRLPRPLPRAPALRRFRLVAAASPRPIAQPRAACLPCAQPTLPHPAPPPPQGPQD